MTDNKTKAYALLEDWSQYKTLHYSNKTQFDKAVDIEIEKDAVARLAGYLRQALMDDACPEQELAFCTQSLESHLRIFKDQVTFEVLRNGHQTPAN